MLIGWKEIFIAMIKIYFNPLWCKYFKKLGRKYTLFTSCRGGSFVSSLVFSLNILDYDYILIVVILLFL